MRSKQEEGSQEAVVTARDKRHSLRRSADKEEAEAMERADSVLQESSALMAATHERMAVTQIEIDKLKAESRGVLNQSRRILEEIKRAA
jgi:hypothetical protein